MGEPSPTGRLPAEARGRRMLGAALGECVHVAGLVNFFHLAQDHGYVYRFLGPAVPVETFVAAIEAEDPDIVAVSYRLTPEAAEKLLAHLKNELARRGLLDSKRFIFGGTPPVCQVARRLGFFEAVFSQESPVEDIVAWLRGEATVRGEASYPRTLVERIEAQAPYPVLRHHFGQPTVEATIEGVARLAEARVLDVVSLGPDQNAQEFFFRPEEMDPKEDGAGGVPVRTAEDLRRIYEASRRGNYPLVRCYSGTQDLLKWGKLLVETIHNAWAATPLFWYSVLDGRSRRPLTESVPEAQALMRYYARLGIPVEMNESHHWSLRDAHDTIAVAAAFLGAYNARACGVRHYVQQLMFNNPRDTSYRMDLAKMLAKLELIEEELAGPDFRVLRETRAGLHFLVTDPDAAKGQLASSTMLQLAVRPHIVHVVGYPEADHAATADEIIESCKIAHGVIRSCLGGLPDMTRDPAVQARKAELVGEARLILNAIRDIAGPGVDDPWTDAATLERAVKIGLLDAPHFDGNPHCLGALRTRMVDGKRVAVDPDTREPLPEAERIRRVLDRHREAVREV